MSPGKPGLVQLVPGCPGEIAKVKSAILLLVLSMSFACDAHVLAAEKPVLSPAPRAPFKPRELPPEPAQDHDANKVLDLGQLRQSALLPLSSTKPIRLEASYTEPMGLEEALKYAVQYNLPIKIAKESWNYQKWQFYGQVADFLPSYATSWNLTNSAINPRHRASNARVYSDTVRYPVFTGGNVVYTALAQYYRERGWKQSYYTSINDALLDVYNKYNNLRLNYALLQIFARSLQVSEAQLKVNNALYSAGTGTRFAIMQSRTQLAADQQALLQQQVAVRQAALLLAYALNMPLAINLLPKEENLSEDNLIDEKTGIDDLLSLAMSFRPELRQYELFQIAAARNVQVAATPLYPSASFFNTYTHASTTVYPGTIEKLQSIVNANQAALTARNKAAAAAASSAAGSSSSSSSASSSAASNSGSSSTTTIANAGVFGGATNTFQAGFSMGWSLPNMGLGTAANIMSARALSRQAMLQANQELLLVDQQVRSDYLTAVTSKAQIDSTAFGVASAKEALRLALMRLQTGTGTNLELIQAQRDYITALTSQAQAIAASNTAQAQLLHDTGVISIETLTRGYHSAAPIKDRRIKP